MKLHIEVGDAERASLEADLFDAEDVVAEFIDEGGHRYTVDLNYRGAHALMDLVNQGVRQRNWKVKFPKTDPYRNRREWNYNYEPNIRQKLAYDLTKLAGVKMPAPRHVRLYVHGEAQGIYLDYEDPDSKDWLTNRFGDNDGDLYKAARDVPGESPYFADLTYLGDTDEDYYLHCDKKTNHKVAPGDYRTLRTFIDDLNHMPDDGFVEWLGGAFNTDAFITYLAVGNFIAHWDGFPQRPKNYWMYNNPSNDRWTYIPWDVDQTFQTGLSELNAMGPYVSIYHPANSARQKTEARPCAKFSFETR